MAISGTKVTAFFSKWLVLGGSFWVSKTWIPKKRCCQNSIKNDWPIGPLKRPKKNAANDMVKLPISGSHFLLILYSFVPGTSTVFSMNHYYK